MPPPYYLIEYKYMKNKFLIPSFLFVFGLLIFLIYPGVSLAAITSVTTNVPAVGLTSATLSGTIDIAGGSERYDRRGFNLGTATANGGDYNMGSSSDTGGPWTGDGTFTHATTTGLSKGTAYYFRAYSASSTSASGEGAPVLDLVYGSERTFITGIDAPSGLVSQSTEDSIKITWTTGTGANKTVIKYNDGTTYPTATSSGSGGATIAETNRTFYNLVPEHTYYFSLWSSTTDTTAVLTTTSDSYVTIKAATTAVVGGGGGVSRTPPVTYSDSLVINAGAATAKTREATLTLKATNAGLMTICNNSDLLNCSLENYSAAKSWTLTEGDGVKTVYAKFVSPDGINSGLISDTIILETPAPTPAPEPTPVPTPEPTPTSTPTPEPTPAPVEKSISEMTKEELTAKIAEIMAQLNALKIQLAELKESVVFENDFGYGGRGDDIAKLQEFLIKEGLLDQDLNTGWFGLLTKAAVIKFQEKYAEEILIPAGFTKGTGFVGEKTRAKLNELLLIL